MQVPDPTQDLVLGGGARASPGHERNGGPAVRDDDLVTNGVQRHWFGEEPGRNEAEAAFLAELRRETAGWHAYGLSPADTESYDIGVPLYAEEEVPAMKTAGRMLQIGFWTGGPWAERSGGAILQGVWGDDHPLDDHNGNDPECLTVTGVDVGPEQHARWAAAWIVRQLQRPVVREEWLRGQEVVATTWRFTDTGTVLRRQGLSLGRLLRRDPDRVTKVR
jgi:hypothetical protein